MSLCESDQGREDLGLVPGLHLGEGGESSEGTTRGARRDGVDALC